jgi:hypothetical protein
MTFALALMIHALFVYLPAYLLYVFLGARLKPHLRPQPFVQGARAETRQKDWNALREAIRGRADHEEIERLWDRCERWI